MAGCSPLAVICEIMKDDGTMARLPDLQLFAAEHGLKIGTIADLIQYRSRNESLVQAHGPATAIAHRARRIHRSRLPRPGQRRHAPGAGQGQIRPRRTKCWCACMSRCRCSISSTRPASARPCRIDQAQAALARHGHGVIVLMHRPEDGEAMLTRATGTAPSCTAKWDPRTYGIGTQILRDLGRDQDAPALQPAQDAFHGRLRP